MLEACSIGPNMINAPWLDKPSKITESELTALETNYESMLSTIHNDTFGGVMPPKYNTSKYHEYLQQQSNRFTKTPHNNNSNISVFIDPSLDNSNLLNDSHINSSSNNLLSQDIFNEDAADLNDSETFMNAAINLSVQRVRQQLNMNESPSVSPIHRPSNNNANDDSVIDINLQSMTATMNEQAADDDDNKNDLSLPFISPSSTDQNESNISRQSRRRSNQLFVPQSISPPLFGASRRSRSEQPLLNAPNQMLTMPNSPIMNMNSPSFSYSDSTN